METYSVLLLLVAASSQLLTVRASDHDPTFQNPSVVQSSLNPYNYVVLLLQDGLGNNAPVQQTQASTTALTHLSFNAPPKSRLAANDWLNHVFGGKRSVESLGATSDHHHLSNSAILSEAFPSQNAVDTAFVGESSVGSILKDDSLLKPPRPSFPVHLNNIQNQHPQGEAYWQGLQGDHAECKPISSCPARYGCFVRQPAGTRCPFCKCNPRPSPLTGGH